MDEIRHIRDIDEAKSAFEITERQKMAADCYLKCGNSKKALLEAGYSEKTVSKKFCREFFGRRYIREYMENKLRREGKVAGEREVMEYLTELLRGGITEEVVVNRQVVSKSPSVRERNKAAELLGKHYGMYNEKGKKENENKNREIEVRIDVDE